MITIEGLESVSVLTLERDDVILFKTGKMSHAKQKKLQKTVDKMSAALPYKNPIIVLHGRIEIEHHKRKDMIQNLRSILKKLESMENDDE